MEYLLAELQIALANKLYFIALQAALSIPDICGAMESDDGKATKTKYCAWYDKYVKSRTSFGANSEDCYLFRCSILHQGTTIPSPRSGQVASFTRIIFVAPYQSNFTLHDCTVNGALAIDVEIFCNSIIKAANEWMEDMRRENNANYNQNAAKAIRYYPQGIAPYTMGIGTIG